MNTKMVKVDVRDDLRAGRDPFSKIMSAAAVLEPQERLLLVAPFKPVPLIRVMQMQGFEHSGQVTLSGDWEILFTRRHEPQTAQTGAKLASLGSLAGAPPNPAKVVQVDARGLEPPQPMLKILEALTDLPADTKVCARTDRRPMHLYAHLEERGFTTETEEQPDGSFLTHIQR